MIVLRVRAMRRSLVRRRHVQRLVRVVAALVVAVVVLPLGTTAAGAQVEVETTELLLQGADPYETSLEVARYFVSESGGSIDAVVIVSGESWTDAVVASGLAGKLDAPVLLTPPDEMSAATVDFLVDAGVSRVMVVGSPEKVSRDVLGQLARFASVERVWRSDAVATSVAVARRMGTPGNFVRGLPMVFVTSLNESADASLAGPIAFQGGHPVLLIPPGELDDRVARYLLSSGAEQVIVLGDRQPYSRAVRDDIVDLGLDVSHLAGSGRKRTEIVVAEFLEKRWLPLLGREGCPRRTTVGLITAWEPFDALSAGPLMGKLCAFLRLGEIDEISEAVASQINRYSRVLIVKSRSAKPAELTPLEVIFDRAAQERAEVIERLARAFEVGRLGVTRNNILRGLSRYRTDLSGCPENWSDRQGVSPSQIRIGLTIPQSGQHGAVANIEDGMRNYFDWVNRHQPVAGTQITLISKDDRYNPQLTIQRVERFIEFENVLSVLTVGSPTTLAAYDQINEACVPHPFVMSGLPAWGDPVNHPWTTGLTMSYTTEATLWGEWIEQNFQDEEVVPVTVAALVSDDELGRTYERAFAAWARAHPEVIEGFYAIRHEPTEVIFDRPIRTLQAYEPDVYISMTSGNACRQAITSAGWLGMADDIWFRGGELFLPSVCKFDPARDTVSNAIADDWLVAGGGIKHIGDPALGDDPFIAFARENLANASLDSTFGPYGTGYFYAYAYVEALRIARELPGGVSRTNLMLAVRSMDISHPMLVDGVRLQLAGSIDAFAIESTDISRFNVETQAWETVGPILGTERATPRCAWIPDPGLCGAG